MELELEVAVVVEEEEEEEEEDGGGGGGYKNDGGVMTVTVPFAPDGVCTTSRLSILLLILL